MLGLLVSSAKDQSILLSYFDLSTQQTSLLLSSLDSTSSSLIVLLDLDDKVLELLRRASARVLASHYWLLNFPRGVQLRYLEELLPKMNFASNVLILKRPSQNVSELYEAYRIGGPSSDVRENLLAKYDWSAEQMEYVGHEYIWERRKNLHGHEFVVAYNENVPFMNIKVKHGYFSQNILSI